ncbi:MAG: GNAT family N-acetyltransferase [Eubacterium sp.]|nr:GNAT family N-acetyltransferase [Eubacterium sp.]
MNLAYEMKYTHPTQERSSVYMRPYSSGFQEAYKTMYNECYHEMREALRIQPYDFIQDDSFFESGMDGVFLLVEDGDLIGSVTLKESEIDDLIVRKAYQRQGVGRQILLWALEHMKPVPVFLHVAGWNRKAIILYRKTGFEITNATAIGGNNMIREARKEDLAQLLELYLFLHEDSIPEQSDHLTKTWDQIIGDPNHHLIVNEIGGRIISSCVCVIIPNLTRNVRPYAFVENVVTHGDHRGHGYAGECLAFARELAEQENCYKMMLLTGSKKPETLHFYEKAGYNSSDKTAFIQWLGM